MSELNATGIQPRGDLVLVQFVLESDKMVGLLKVPTGDNEYVEAKVLAVGPGVVGAAGAVSYTADLAPGDTVLLQHKKKVRDQQGVIRGEKVFTIPVKSRFSDDKNLYLIPEPYIVLIQNEYAELPDLSKLD